MKILILGDGVIGSVYGHELSVSGNEVVHFIRTAKAKRVAENGIKIRCLDCRKGNNKNTSFTYKPKVISELKNSDRFDLFIISTKANTLISVLESFRDKISPETPVLIFQTMWQGAYVVEKALGSNNFIFGFPHIVGGGRDENGIYCTIFGNKNAPTMLGERNGKITGRLMAVSNVLENADMNPLISDDILGWIYTHYAEAAGLLAGVMQTDDYVNFASDKDILKKTILAIREGLRVCKARGVNVKKIKPQCYYFLPTWIMVPLMQKMYSGDGAKLMVKGHITHSLEEMKSMVFEMIAAGRSYHIDTPQLDEMAQKVKLFEI